MRALQTLPEDVRKAVPEDLPDPSMSENALRVLNKRYLQKDEDGEVTETPRELFWRVARALAEAERNYGAEDDVVVQTARRFYRLMAGLEFLPNSPTLMNAGLDLGQLSACFVLPVSDDLGSIFEAVKWQALIHQSGGGTGFSFSRLRPKGDFVKSTMGVASGPVSFMRIFDAATEQVKQGGKRRGANMGILRVDHPDIEEFITCKAEDGEIHNFNISVALTNDFMEAWKAGESYELVNPRTGEGAGQKDARAIMDKIAHYAWLNGEPGLFFLDRANEHNPLAGEIEATNPCGEQALHPFDSCNLGSIVLDKHVSRAADGSWEVDWDHLRESVRTSVRLLDNVIDCNKYPIPQIEDTTSAHRRIGLGIMGFARALFKLRVAYDSPEGLEWAERFMAFIQEEAEKASMELAEERGPYPAWETSTHKTEGKLRRNAFVTTIAPTGTISMIADTSGGCEPEFSLIWYKNVMDGEHLPYFLDYFQDVAEEEGFWTEDLTDRILANEGSCQGIDQVPERWQKVFTTAMGISPEWHVRMQAAFQKHTENQISKTINLPADATEEDVKDAYLLAWDSGCRGITVYRDRSRSEQVMNLGESQRSEAETERQLLASAPAGLAVLKPRPRPDVVIGTTQKIETGYGKLYVTINEDDAGLFEVFATIGRGGGYTASFTEALARMVSLALRSSIPVEEIVAQLQGIRSPRIAWDNGKKVMSVPDALALALERQRTDELHKSIQARVDNFQEVPPNPVEAPVRIEADTEAEKELAGQDDSVRALIRAGMNPECPECASMLVLQEGCAKCLACGYSEC